MQSIIYNIFNITYNIYISLFIFLKRDIWLIKQKAFHTKNYKGSKIILLYNIHSPFINATITLHFFLNIFQTKVILVEFVPKWGKDQF